MLTCKILIVDDDPDDREILLETFQHTGVDRVHGVGSAEAAIAFLQAVRDDQDLPKLIVTDLNMPGISGNELLRALKEMSRYQHIPVIVCSTSSSSEEAKNCLAAGAEDYIIKPSLMSDYMRITDQMSMLAAS